MVKKKLKRMHKTFPIEQYQGFPPVIVGGIDLMPYVLDLVKYMCSIPDLNIKPVPNIIFSKSQEYAQDVFGKTAYYNPTNKTITVFTANRHPKDVLRSIPHELIHHDQNMREDMSADLDQALSDPLYSQHNQRLREFEEEAYLRGNMYCRDLS